MRSLENSNNKILLIMYLLYSKEISWIVLYWKLIRAAKVGMW